jgi:hypothetical protein
MQASMDEVELRKLIAQAEGGELLVGLKRENYIDQRMLGRLCQTCMIFAGLA